MDKPRRNRASVNKSSSTDFVWPDNFDRQENRETQSIPNQQPKNTFSEAVSSSSNTSIQRKRIELDKEKENWRNWKDK